MTFNDVYFIIMAVGPSTPEIIATSPVPLPFLSFRRLKNRVIIDKAINPKTRNRRNIFKKTLPLKNKGALKSAHPL